MHADKNHTKNRIITKIRIINASKQKIQLFVNFSNTPSPLTTVIS